MSYTLLDVHTIELHDTRSTYVIASIISIIKPIKNVFFVYPQNVFQCFSGTVRIRVRIHIRVLESTQTAAVRKALMDLINSLQRLSMNTIMLVSVDVSVNWANIGEFSNI